MNMYLGQDTPPHCCTTQVLPEHSLSGQHNAYLSLLYFHANSRLLGD